jgi:hypothetical protein
MTTRATASPEAQASGAAVWSSTPERPWTRYLDQIACADHTYAVHTASQSATTAVMPDDFVGTLFRNHQAVQPCSHMLGDAPGTVTASASFDALYGIKPDTTAALAQTAGQIAAPFGMDTYGRVSLTQAGTLTLTATFYLLQTVGQGAGGISALRLPAASVPNLTAPSVVTGGLADSNGHATATLYWTGNVAANTSIEVDYWNGSAVVQDVQGGSLSLSFLTGSIAAVASDDPTGRNGLRLVGEHWVDVIDLGASTVVEAGCASGWSGHREGLGAGTDRESLVADLLAEHDLHSSEKGTITWHLVGSTDTIQRTIPPAVAPRTGATTATWTIEQTNPWRWASVVECQHGITRAGVWTPGPIVDDRNLLAEAEPAFVNHQRLHADCDCTLEINWTPTFVPEGAAA